MPSTVAGTLLRPDNSPYRGASFKIEAIAPGGALISSATVLTGEGGGYSVTISTTPGIVYRFVPLSTNLPPQFNFLAPSEGTTVDLMSLAPVGDPVDVDEAAILEQALNTHIASSAPHPNYDGAVVFEQSAAASWYVTNPFSRRADVMVVVNDEEVITDVEVTDTYVHVTFASPQAGQLVLS